MGRPWPAPGEPLWLEEDRDLVVAVLEHRRRRCPNCGLTPEDLGWYDQDGKMHRHEEPRFTPSTIRCFGCFDIEATREEVPEDERRALYVVMTPTPAVLGV